MVNDIGEPGAVCLGEDVKIASFPRILSNESIGIFIGSSFPGMVGVAEIEFYGQYGLDIFVIVKFGTVVDGDGFNAVSRALEVVNDGSGNAFGGLVLKLADGQVPGFSLHHGKEAVLGASGPHDRVGFPMAKVFPGVHGGWSFINTAFSDEYSSVILAAISFTALFAAATKMAIDLPSLAVVFPDILVDAFMADQGAFLFP